MMKKTNDFEVTWGVATQKDSEGNLTGIQIGMTEDEAKNMYNSFQAFALMRIVAEVVSSIDLTTDTEGNYID